MIKRIDEMLKLWAQDLHSPVPENVGGPSGGNMIAMLMECKGELIRGTRGSRVPPVGQPHLFQRSEVGLRDACAHPGHRYGRDPLRAQVGG